MFKISKAIEDGNICKETRVVNKVTDGMFYTSQVYDALDATYTDLFEKYNNCKRVLKEFKKMELPSEYTVSNRITECGDLYSKVSTHIGSVGEWHIIYNNRITMDNVKDYVEDVLSNKEEHENIVKTRANIRQVKKDFERNIMSKVLEKYKEITIKGRFDNSYVVSLEHIHLIYDFKELETLTYEKMCKDIDGLYDDMSNLLSVIDEINNCKNKRWRCEYDGYSYKLYLRDMFYGNKYKDVAYVIVSDLTNTTKRDKIKECFRKAMISMIDDEHYRYDNTYVRFYLED